MTVFKVLVCGGRNYGKMVYETMGPLNRLHVKYEFTHVIHGAQRGADTMAGDWAERNGIHAVPVKALWGRYGNAAGPIRNQRMLELGPDLVVAFPGGSGTADMVRRAKAANIQVIEIAEGRRLEQYGNEL